jgi:hypothetical protein
MNGLLNNIIHGNSTAIGATAASIATKAGELQTSTYENYYLKLAAADLCYNFENKRDNYYRELISLNDKELIKDDEMTLYKLAPFLFFALNFTPITQNPCSVTLLLPALKVITLIAGLFKWFSIKMSSLAWAYSFFHVTGITILTAFAIPAALLTAVAFYRVLILPHEKDETKNISATESIVALSIFIAPIFVPILFPVICLLFAACFLYNRNLNVSSNHERIKYLLGIENSEYIFFPPDLSLGFNYAEDMGRMKNITTSSQERQRYNFGIFFFLSHTAFNLYSTFSITATFATAPLLTGAYVFIMLAIAVSAIALPIYATFQPPEKTITNESGSLEKITPTNALDQIIKMKDDSPQLRIHAEEAKQLLANHARSRNP